MHVLENGICTACQPIAHVFDNGVCVTCPESLARHLPGKHDQSSHGRRRAGKASAKGVADRWADLRGKPRAEALAALGAMTRAEVYELAKHLGEQRGSKLRKRQLVDLVLTHHGGAAPRSVLQRGSDRLAEVAAHYRDNPREYEGRRRKSYDTHYDVSLKEIVELQGFDAKPQVATRAELDAAVAAGWVEVWRGVSPNPKTGRTPAEINNEFRFGAFEPGRGVYGNGVYASRRRNTAETYRDRDPKGNLPIGGGPDFGPEDFPDEPRPDSMLRLAVDPAARTVDYDELKAEVAGYLQALPEGSPEAAVLADVGRYAAARGYDVLIVRGHGDGAFYPGWETDEMNDEDFAAAQADQYVILNRSAVMIQRAEDVP